MIFFPPFGNGYYDEFNDAIWNLPSWLLMERSLFEKKIRGEKDGLFLTLFYGIGFPFDWDGKVSYFSGSFYEKGMDGEW